MRTEYAPQRIIPESNVVRWKESEHPDLQIVETTVDGNGSAWPSGAHLVPNVEAWLDGNAPGWSVEFDRGDFGDGVLSVVLTLPSKRASDTFVAEWSDSFRS